MNPIRLVLGIHNHQPVGNFDFVFEEATAKAYRPFLEVLEAHPSIPFAIHNSGVLYDWWEARDPGLLDLLGRLVARGQVELLTGAHFEPILPMIEDRDKDLQIRRLTAYLGRRFGASPTSLWLAERVWEPGLVAPIVRAGARAVFVDDAHFLAAGLDPEELHGYFLTEDQGLTLAVFPISKPLRYLVPFDAPERSVEHLARVAGGGPGRLAVLVDDGEKFGVWPGTHRLVYDEGWLDAFFGLLERNRDWIRLLTPAAALAELPPRGLVYLPAASYAEMMEWSLPVAAQGEYEALLARLAESGAPAGALRFVRGGFWRNFFAKYPEANAMHKRMLLARGRIDEGNPRALEEIHRAQCNCAYWHGVFGGLYLPHLRDAVYRAILESERISGASVPGALRGDWNRDGREEILLENAEVFLSVHPGEGGAVSEISSYALARNFGNTLARRPEVYHAKLRDEAAGDGGGPGRVASIHERVRVKEAGLARLLHYDSGPRRSFVDHFLPAGPGGEGLDPGALSSGTIPDLGDFAGRAYEILEVESAPPRVLLRRAGVVAAGGEAVPVVLEKTFTLPAGAARILATYEIRNPAGGAVELFLGVELSLSLLAGDAPDRTIRIPGRSLEAPRFASRGNEAGVERVELRDDREGYSLRLEWDRPAVLSRFPIETVSQSEDGFERVYQSTTLLPIFRLRLRGGGTERVAIRLSIEGGARG